jgi:hypothetical protein
VSWNVIALKNPMYSAEFEPANLGSSGKYSNHYTTEGDLLDNVLLSDDQICVKLCFGLYPSAGVIKITTFQKLILQSSQTWLQASYSKVLLSFHLKTEVEPTSEMLWF